MDQAQKLLWGVTICSAAIAALSWGWFKRSLDEAKKANHEYVEFDKSYKVDRLLEARKELSILQKGKTVPLLVRSQNKPSWVAGVQPLSHIITGRTSPNQQVFKGVNGLPFNLTVQQQIGVEHRLACQIKEATVTVGVLNASPIPETAKEESHWYLFWSKLNIPDLDFKHSKIRTSFTLRTTGITLFGVLHLDELNKLKYTVSFIASTASEILSYFQNKKDVAEGKVIVAGFALMLFGFCTYKLSQWLQAHREYRRLLSEPVAALSEDREAVIDAPYLLARTSDRLNCLYCKKNIANVAPSCGHLMMCEACCEMSHPCPECNEEPKRRINVFVS